VVTEIVPLRTRLGASLLRIGLGVHAIGSLLFWILQPHGFAWGTRSFLEHQVIAPALAVSAAALAAGPMKRPSVTALATAILSGFWMASGGVIAVLGTTAPSRLFWIVPPASVMMLVLVRRQAPNALLTGGTVLGVAVAGLFWFATWAPPPSTRPASKVIHLDPMTREASSIESEGVRVSVSGNLLQVASGGKIAYLWPGFDYEAVSDAGIWSLFQFRTAAVPSWTCGRTDRDGLAVRAENDDFQSAGRVWIDHRVVHVRMETRVKRDLASHLASAFQLALSGQASVQGVPWNLGNSDPRSEFIAVRQGRTELLRASSGEKGPFEVLASWPVGDPVLKIEGWSIQLLGWADQGSHEPSPTAGWGVSQAAIERAGSAYFWSLASTSIGRGWHTVRTGPGVYVLEAVVTPP
jgi:hypothetical protein